MTHKEMEIFMNLLLKYDWSIKNYWHSNDVFYFADGELIWEIFNDKLYKTNELTFFSMGKEGTKATSIKDIYSVSDNGGNELKFYGNALSDWENFVRNL